MAAGSRGNRFEELTNFLSLSHIRIQLSRWGYNSLEKMEQVVQEMLDSGIPYDAQYGDIDYMDEKRDFTYDPVAFAGFPEFVQKLQNDYNMHYIVILDPGTCLILVKACL